MISRQMSSISVDMPVATASVVNKTANRSASLYQNCLEARALMRRVPGFEQGPWIQFHSLSNPDDQRPITPRPQTPKSKSSSILNNSSLDPVSQTLDIIRLGSPLCYLYNAILLDPISPPDLSNIPPLPPGKTWKTIKPLQVVWCPREDLKGCQKSAAHFIMAVKTELGWGTEIDDSQAHGLMVNMLYDQNTNATVKVISNVLRLLHLLKALGVLLPPTEDDLAPFSNESNGVMDDRARVVKEILESERKYVQDLEVLQNYQRALLQREVLPSDQIRALFMNLDSLVDFQRRFLIGVEANARLPPDEQRFGHLFETLEDLFTCYEPFCANFASASQLAQDENAALLQVSDVLDPNYELPTFLIKPVQRICKYPLLLQQLVKHSNPNGPYYEELKDGLASITRVTDGVNETTRQRENELAVNDLKERVEDWKGHELGSFGALVLEDTFMVVKNESEREYHVYLFERIILCCKEVGTKLDKKASKQSISLKKNSQASHLSMGGGKRKNTQQLKGRIFIANVMSANPRPVPPGSPHNQYLLQVTWRGDLSEEYFSIKCRTEEQLKKWQAAITKAVDDALERRRRQAHHASTGSRTKMNSPLSQFPNTPQSEMGPPPPFHSGSYPSHILSHHHRIPEHYPYSHSGHGNGGGSISSRNFEDEEDSYQTDAESSSTNGRHTPSGTRRTQHRSMPAERSEASSGPGRARAQTDDASSANLAQWRNQMPSSLPPVPRTGQTTAASSEAYMSSSLRSSTSSRHLRHKQSHEWGASASGPMGGMYRMEEETMAHLPPSAGWRPGANGSAGPPGSGGPPGSAGTPMFRSRSASSPNIHQPVEAGGVGAAWPGQSNGVPSVPSIPQGQQSLRGLPLPSTIRAGQGHAKQRSSDSSGAGGTDRSSTESLLASGGTQQHPHVNGSLGRTSGAGVNMANHQAERYSSSQTTTTGTSSLVTSRSSGSLVTSSAPTANNNEPIPPSSIRFKLRAGEDTYVIVTLTSIGYGELVEKISKKLKNCGVYKSATSTGSPQGIVGKESMSSSSNSVNGIGINGKMRIRYEDEEGDLILIGNDDDVMIAVEWCRSLGSGCLVLFID